MICIRSDADRSGLRIRSLSGKADTTESAPPHEIKFSLTVGLKKAEGFSSLFQRGFDDLFPPLELVGDGQRHFAAAVIVKGLFDKRSRRQSWSSRGSYRRRSGNDHGT